MKELGEFERFRILETDKLPEKRSLKPMDNTWRRVFDRLFPKIPRHEQEGGDFIG